jgi:uncharacterized DUF497 family protein
VIVGGRGNTDSPAPEPSLKFEWDPAKSAMNKEKHGVDFEEAQAIWQDLDRTAVASGYVDEARTMTTGLLNGKLYTAVTTVRGDNIRIISVRRARGEEEARHGGEQGDD